MFTSIRASSRRISAPAAPRFPESIAQLRRMSAQNGTVNLPTDSSLPGEHFEIRQTATSDDYHPDPSKSIKLSPARQALLDDIIALYSCQPTRERVKRYTPDCVYDDQFVYANDRYKMAGQWFALPKLFKESKNEGYEVIKNEPGFIQFKNEQVRTRSARRSFAPLLISITDLDIPRRREVGHHQRTGHPIA